MKNINSFSLFILATSLLILANFVHDAFIKIICATVSILLAILAAVKSFKEKNKN